MPSAFRSRIKPALLALLLVAVFGVIASRTAATPRVAAAPPGCTGDVSGDNVVNSLDLLGVAQRFGPSSNPLYDPQYDVNGDTFINSLDLLIVALHFGACPTSITIYVSDLVPTGTPINGFGPFERDTSNGEDSAGDGHPITMNGIVYPKGLGVHAQSDLYFTVPPGCTTFLAQVGVDAEVSLNGSVVFQVFNNTATTALYTSPLKLGGQAATAVSVSMAGVTTLHLAVNNGGDNNNFDHGDWGDAKFSCASGDVTAPTISAIGAAPTGTTAAITWTTNEIATTQVEYGTTAAYGTSVPLDTLLVTSHAQTINGLTPGTLYHYRIRSRDPWGNLGLSADQTFTTTASLLGPGAFFSAAGMHTHSVVLRDLNGDGKLDVVTANAGSDTISVMLGDGAGNFTLFHTYGTGSQPKSVQLGDVNNDGKLDAITANQNDSTISVLLGNGDGTFNAATNIPGCTNSHEATLAFLNADTNLDIACAGWGAPFMGVLLGNGNGTFAPMVSYAAGAAPHSIVAHDFNGDGKQDLAVANHDGNSISVYLGNGDGTFVLKATYNSGTGPHSIRTADLNGDGKFDLVNVNDASDDVSVFMGNGDGTFKPAVKYATNTTPKGVAIADINGDGKLDILAATIDNNYPTLVNPGGDYVSVLLGNGDGTFQPRTDFRVGQGSFAVAAGLINGDNKLDIVTADWWDGGITVRLNTGP